MDNHPIPQDVTGFQFRLIGDMTIKQFAYLAAGAVLAWIIFSLPIFALIKLPLAVALAGIGAILAFVPIAGRPADSMIFYFFKAVFSPTQYAYKQTSDTQTTAVEKAPEEKKPDEKKEEEKVQLTTPTDTDAFHELFGEKKPEKIAPIPQEEAVPQQPVAENPAVIENETPQELGKEATTLAQQIMEAQKEETTAQNQEEAQQAHQKVSDLESQMQLIQQQKQELEAKILELQKQLAQKQEQTFTPSTMPEPKTTANVRKVPANLSTSVGAPFVGDAPNLISGIVKDPRGNVLPNILIEVKDKDGNPVRAFKTNPLGQFASATPVINGTYTISFEDPNNKQRFDSVELTANGDILQPLEVISADAREDLRKELFG